MQHRGTHGAGTLDAETGQRSIAEVLKDVISGIQQLIRSEIKLAKVEIAESMKPARSSAMFFASAGVCGLFALGFVLLAVMFALEIVLPNWLSALIVGILLMVGAGTGAAMGRQRLRSIRAPRKTMETVKEDLQWISEQPRS